MSTDEAGVLTSRRAILKGSLAGGLLGISGVSLAASPAPGPPATAPAQTARKSAGRSPFPHDFAWGVATSAYQIEGAVAEDGRAPSVWDVFVKRPGAIYEGQTGDLACDHYHRFKEDVALMKRLGVKAYRFSVSWTRVLPEGTGTQNPKGFDFYHRLLDELGKAGVQPMCTLFHWDFPQALYRQVTDE